MIKIFVILNLLCSFAGYGQSSKKAPAKGEIIEFKPPSYTPTPQPTLSKSKLRALCKKYENQYVGFYTDVYKIEGCKKRKIELSKDISRITQKHKIHEVSAEVIAAIPHGKPFMDIRPKRTFSCANIEGRYVTVSNVNVYLIQGCRKRIFPDWSTFVEHSKKKSRKNATIIAIPNHVFFKLKKGKAIASVFEKKTKKDSGEAEQEITLIPVDEACEGLNGKYFSYYSKIVKIEKCHKREVKNPSLFSENFPRIVSKMKEIDSDRWVSLPNGPVIAN